MSRVTRVVTTRRALVGLLTLAVAFWFTAGAQAQKPQVEPRGDDAPDALIKDFGSPQIEQFIKDVIGAPVNKKELQGGVVVYSTPNLHYDMLLVGPAKVVYFTYEFEKRNEAPEALNKWNGDLHLTHVCIRNGKVNLMASLDLGRGLTVGQFNNFYQRIQQEFKEFSKRPQAGQ